MDWDTGPTHERLQTPVSYDQYTVIEKFRITLGRHSSTTRSTDPFIIDLRVCTGEGLVEPFYHRTLLFLGLIILDLRNRRLSLREVYFRVPWVSE